MIKKALILDSSSIITLALNNLLGVLELLKKSFGGKFLITPKIKEEIIDNPLKQKRFELEALLISTLLKKGVIEVSAPAGLEKEIKNIMGMANNAFIADGETINILHEGESSCFALANLLKEEYQICIAIDERTARLLCENPENLKKIFDSKLHTKVSIDRSKTAYFSGLSIIRSAELLFVAYKKGLIDLPASNQQAIDALLYAAKFKGCSISFEEIERAKKII